MTHAGLFDLSGRTALVTGSTRGLGLALARALAGAGGRVAISGRSAEAAEEVAATIEGAVAAPFDVTDEAAVAAGVTRLGPVDVLVNNAGITVRLPLVDVSADTWRHVLDVNLTSAFLVARAVAPGMIERGRGKIVNVGSVMSELARETVGPYAATKGALKMLTRSMCAEWDGTASRRTRSGRGTSAPTSRSRCRRTRSSTRGCAGASRPGGGGEPQELAGAVVFLASAASDFVNGQIIYVDGGLVAVV